MARGMVGVAVSFPTGSLAIALMQHLPFLVCVVAVAGLCVGYARHRALHRESSETDGEMLELRSGRDSALSSYLIQIKRNPFSFSLKHSFSRSVISSKQGSDVVSDEDVSNVSPAIWQKAILRGERCVPLSFSGLVLYDEKGNLLPRRNKSFIRD